MSRLPPEEVLAKMPGLFSQPSIPRPDLVIYLRCEHLESSSEWYMAQYAPTSKLFFCYTIHHDNVLAGAWGVWGLDQLCQFGGHGVSWDDEWEPRKVSDIERIVNK